MHFKTILFAGLTSLAAVAALPSGAHDGHVVARHHRFIRPRKDTPVSAKKRCTASSTSSSAAPEPTDDKAGNIAANKPTFTLSTKSAKFTTIKTKSTSQTATETDTTEAAAPTSGTGGISINDKLLAIFPAGTASGKSKWSTNPAVNGAMVLSDSAIRATKVAKLPHPVVDFQGKKAQQVTFEKGSYAYRGSAQGGISMYALGPANQPITNAKKFTFSYSVFFEDGFKFNQGGKLPGIFGGTGPNDTGCSGGRGRTDCFSLRFMWRKNGEGELYAYLPTDAKPTNKAAVCSKTNTSCDAEYGWSLGRGTWDWTPGQWHTIAQVITLNDLGKNNGSVDVYHNGKKVYSANNIIIRTTGAAKPQGAMIQSFFGGHTTEWASPQTQKMYLADYSLAVLE
ncbi:polysaccharide lyase family 14 protein [Ceratobasidium sp. AG-Ba]|nr:polysaccharide lyase family 14 protein [Ceratobasidium sp. AG-Ba]